MQFFGKIKAVPQSTQTVVAAVFAPSAQTSPQGERLLQSGEYQSTTSKLLEANFPKH
ncbi:MAG: hypothetical protein H6638_10200 [Ardenticatenales bacterium]|nr:hypothetical protein [Ardenticatenales bacterium]